EAAHEWAVLVERGAVSRRMFLERKRQLGAALDREGSQAERAQGLMKMRGAKRHRPSVTRQEGRLLPVGPSSTSPYTPGLRTLAGTNVPTLGPRGEGWVLLQSLVFGTIVASGLLGADWPHRVQSPLRAVGAALELCGLVLGVLGIRALGSSFTPFP